MTGDAPPSLVRCCRPPCLHRARSARLRLDRDTQRPGRDRPYHRHLCREPKLRSSLWLVSRRRGHCRRDRRAEDAARSRRHGRCRTCRPSTSDGKPDPRFPPRCRTGRSASTRRRSTGATTRCCRAHGTSTTRTASRSTAGRTTCTSPCPTPAPGRWAISTARSMKLWKWAQEYTLADHFFMGAFGGSFLNHFWLVCACTPHDPDVAASACAPQLDEHGNLLKRSRARRLGAAGAGAGASTDARTPDGYLGQHVAAALSAERHSARAGGNLDLADPRRAAAAPAAADRPNDRRHALGEGRELGMVRRRLGCRARRRPAPPGRNARRHLQRAPRQPDLRAASPAVQLLRALRAGPAGPRAASQGRRGFPGATSTPARLPQVAFFKPAGRYTEHPSYTDIASGDEHIAMLLDGSGRARSGRGWRDRHLRRERRLLGSRAAASGPGWSDRWGPGTRIPALIVSPFAKRGYVDKTPYDTTSIIKFITRRFGLEPLPGVREKAGDLTSAFSF